MFESHEQNLLQSVVSAASEDTTSRQGREVGTGDGAAMRHGMQGLASFGAQLAQIPHTHQPVNRVTDVQSHHYTSSGYISLG